MTDDGCSMGIALWEDPRGVWLWPGHNIDYLVCKCLKKGLKM